MVWFALVQVKNRHERSMPRWPPRSGETSRLGSRDPVVDGTKCGPHGARTSGATCVDEPVQSGASDRGLLVFHKTKAGAG